MSEFMILTTNLLNLLNDKQKIFKFLNRKLESEILNGNIKEETGK